MHVSYALPLLSVPLALLVPAPKGVVRRAATIGLLLLGLSALLIVGSGTLLLVLEDAYPGIALAMLSVTVFVAMLWTAGAPGRNPPEDGDDGGGGGGRGPVPPPEAPDAPDGLGIDWDDFDRLRNEWSDDHSPATPT